MKTIFRNKVCLVLLFIALFSTSCPYANAGATDSNANISSSVGISPATISNDVSTVVDLMRLGAGLVDLSNFCWGIIKMSRVNENNLPHIHEFTQKASEKLKTPAPRIFLLETQMVSIFSFGIWPLKSIFISRGLAEVLEKNELESLVAVEMLRVSHNHDAYRIGSFPLLIATPFALSSLSRFMEKNFANAATKEHFQTAERIAFVSLIFAGVGLYVYMCIKQDRNAFKFATELVDPNALKSALMKFAFNRNRNKILHSN